MDDLTRAGYPEIQHVLDRLVSRFGWNPIMEGDKIIGCKRDGQSVTLEPGGQFELSGAPLANLHQTCDEVQSHLYQAKTISEELNVGFLGVGFDPKWGFEDIPRMPKDRYKIMREYMPKVGTLGLDMMFRSCTIQVWLYPHSLHRSCLHPHMLQCSCLHLHTFHRSCQACLAILRSGRQCALSHGLTCTGQPRLRVRTRHD